VRSYKLLFADNNRKTLELMTELFEHLGCRVLTASNPREACAILNERWVHLAIIDMRLTDDLETDRSGMHLVKTCAPSVPKIIWTNFPHHTDAAEVMRHNTNGYQPAVDYVDKKAGAESLIQSVQQTLDDNVPLNWDLTINERDHPHADAANTVRSILMSIDRPTNSLLDERTEELTDLFRLLFADKTTQLTITRMLSERQGFVIFEAKTFEHRRETGQCLIACGQTDVIRNMMPQYERYGARFGISRLRSRATTHFAAATYTISGDLERSEQFHDYYHRATLDQLQTIISHICDQILKPLCQRETVQSDSAKVAAFYRQMLGVLPQGEATIDDLRTRIKAICEATNAVGDAMIEYGPRGLTLHSIANGSELLSFPSAALDYERICEASSPLYAVINGGLHPDTIIVNPQVPQAWLCDYSRAGYGPILHDFVMLETAIKFYLLGNTSLAERALIERRLEEAPSLSTPLVSDGCSPQVRRSLVCIGRVRFHAAGLRPDVDLRSYQVGLLYCALSQILIFDPKQAYLNDPIPYAHCVLSAARLHRSITTRHASAALSADSFLIDEDHMGVRINEEFVKLSPTEMAVIRYLYERRGKVCSREDLIREALQQPINHPGDLLSYKSMLDTRMSRLRGKIQPASRGQAYLQTIHGKGYKLNV